MPAASLSWGPHLTFQKRQRRQVPYSENDDKRYTIFCRFSNVALERISSARARRLTVCIAYRLSTTRHVRQVEIFWMSEAPCEIDNKFQRTEAAVPPSRYINARASDYQTVAARDKKISSCAHLGPILTRPLPPPLPPPPRACTLIDQELHRIGEYVVYVAYINAKYPASVHEISPSSTLQTIGRKIEKFGREGGSTNNKD